MGPALLSRHVAEPASAGRVGPSGMNSDGDSEYDVLILDAATKQSLASVRSLGRGGLRVVAGECFADCAPTSPVIGFRSRHSLRNLVLPSYAADAVAFGAKVVEFVREHPTRVVLPTMDGSVSALVPWRAELAELGCMLALPSDEALAVANDKDKTLAIAERLGIDYPKSIRIDSLDQVPAVLESVSFPVVLKPTVSWVLGASARLAPVDVVNKAEATSTIEAFLNAGARVLVQEWASGQREGVTLFVADEEVLGCCAHVALRTSPPLGGASVMRKSVLPPSDIYDSAVSLVKAIGLAGVCDVEFRRDAAGRPLLMEVNARLGGTSENSVLSGVDLPWMIWEWATGQPVTPVAGCETGVRTRWLRGDMRWLHENYGRYGRPDSVSLVRALWMFSTEFVKTRHYDCVDWRDLGPAFAELRNTAIAVRRSLEIMMHFRRIGRL
jgi:glutathione synthase/RimK-type ligase-like ATP-grasp enzyme